MDTDFNALSLIIVVPVHHNAAALGHERSAREHLLVRCIESLLAAASANAAERVHRWRDIDICVVDDRSSPSIDTLLPSRLLREVGIFPNEGVPGQGGALNHALANMDADVFAFTDSDCVVTTDWCTCLLARYCQDESLSGVAGPNWYFTPATTRWLHFLTLQESRLLAHTFANYLDSERTITRRIDCRSFSIRGSIVRHSVVNGGFFVEGNGPSTSSLTSYRIQARGEGGSLRIGFASNFIALHAPIDGFLSLITTYFRRGRYGLFRSIYAAPFGGLGKAFIRHYFRRHFIDPWAKDDVSLMYVVLVHSAYWLGILISPQRS